MTWLAGIMNGLFDLLTAPFGGGAALAVAVISAVTGVIMLVLFKYSTNQDKLVAARQILTGHVYEMGLFPDHLSVLARIQGRLLRANLRYLRCSLPALLVLLPPTVLIMAQLNARYEHRPFQPGETTLVEVVLEKGQAPLLPQLLLSASPGLEIASRPLTDPVRERVFWEVRINEPGEHRLELVFPGGERLTTLLQAGPGAQPLAAGRSRDRWLHPILYPAAEPLPDNFPVRAINCELPSRSLDYGPISLHWLLAFIIFSLLAGLAFKDLFKVRF
jgi:hypothetical protein